MPMLADNELTPARQDLQPYFPAHDQKQSLDLRTNLLRSLEQIKKDGVLGRDVILRKTMLDECKGERLEEVLAVFSSAVLKKAVIDSALPDCPILQLATGNISKQNGRQDQVTALTLTLRHSIRKLMDEKSTAHARFADFAELLALSERSILRRQEVVKAFEETIYNASPPIDEHDRATYNAAVRGGWTSNAQWAEVLLQGNVSSAGVNVLSTASEKVWDKVKAGHLDEIERHDRSNALQELDARVRVQQERLRRWKAFSHEMRDKNAKEAQNIEPQGARTRRTLALGLDGPRPMLAGHSKQTELLISKQTMPRKYATLLQCMQEELSLRTELPDQNQAGSVTQRPEMIGTKVRLAQEPDVSSDRANPEVQIPQATRTGADRSMFLPESNPELPPDQPREDRAESECPDRQETAPLVSMSVSPAAELSIPPAGASSPPKKTRHVLTLADRTRLSMARQSTRELPHDLDDLESARPVETATAALPSHVMAQSEEVDQVGEEHVHEDLLSRTRRSMAGFEAARAKARLERRRSQRISRHVPSVQASGGGLDELAEGQEAGHEDTSLFLAETLLAAGGEDEEAVFKSRPKIKTSPAGTPRRLEQM
jgi:hypothetical protein